MSHEVGDHADGVESTLTVDVVVLPGDIETSASGVVIVVVLGIEPSVGILTALLIVGASDLTSDLSGSLLVDPELAGRQASLGILALNGVVVEHVLGKLVDRGDRLHSGVTDEGLGDGSGVGAHKVTVLVDGTGETVMAGSEGKAVLDLEDLTSVDLDEVVVLDLLDAVLFGDVGNDSAHVELLLVGDSGGSSDEGNSSEFHFIII